MAKILDANVVKAAPNMVERIKVDAVVVPDGWTITVVDGSYHVCQPKTGTYFSTTSADDIATVIASLDS